MKKKILLKKITRKDVWVDEVKQMKEFWEDFGSYDINETFVLDKRCWNTFDNNRLNIWRQNYQEDYQVVERTKLQRINEKGEIKKIIVKEQIFSPIDFYVNEILFSQCLNKEIKFYYDRFDSNLIKLWKICLNRVNFCLKHLEFSNYLLKFCKWQIID